MRQQLGRHAALLILIGLPACLLGGCQQDPFDRPGTWSVPRNQLGSNDQNLRTMIADPRDLAAGTGEANSESTAAAPAVRRLQTGKRLPLPQSGVANLRVGGNSSPSGGAGGASPQQ